MILNWNFVGMWFDLTGPETSWLAHRDALDIDIKIFKFVLFNVSPF